MSSPSDSKYDVACKIFVSVPQIEQAYESCCVNETGVVTNCNACASLSDGSLVPTVTLCVTVSVHPSVGKTFAVLLIARKLTDQSLPNFAHTSMGLLQISVQNLKEIY